MFFILVGAMILFFLIVPTIIIKKMLEAKLEIKSWQSFGLSGAASALSGMVTAVLLGDLLWGVVAILVITSAVIIPKMEKIPVGYKGVGLFAGARIGRQEFIKVDGEERPNFVGGFLKEGWQLLPLLISTDMVDIRLQTAKILGLKVYTKDKIGVTLDTDVPYYIKNPQQSLGIKSKEEIDKGINELTEAVVRDVVKEQPVDNLVSNAAHRKNIRKGILEAVRKSEEIFGVDIIDAFVGEIKAPPKIESAWELTKQNSLYAEARKELGGIPEDEKKEATQLNLGVAKKTISENKVDLGATFAKVLAEAFVRLFKK